MKKLLSGAMVVLLILHGSFLPVVAAQTATAKFRVILTDYDLDATSGGGGIYAADASVAATGTGTNAGAFSVAGYERFNVSIYVTQLNVTGGIESRLLCRASGDGYWQQVRPVLADGTVTPSYVTLAAVGGYYVEVQGPWHSCRVHLQINSADDGGDLTTNSEKLNIRLIGR